MPRPASRTNMCLYQIAKAGRELTKGTDAILNVRTCVQDVWSKTESIIASNLHCGNEVTNEVVSDQVVSQQHLTEHQMQILPCQFGQLQDLICTTSSCKLY